MAKSVPMMRSAWRACFVPVDVLARSAQRMTWNERGRRVFHVHRYATRYLKRHAR